MGHVSVNGLVMCSPNCEPLHRPLFSACSASTPYSCKRTLLEDLTEKVLEIVHPRRWCTLTAHSSSARARGARSFRRRVLARVRRAPTADVLRPSWRAIPTPSPRPSPARVRGRSAPHQARSPIKRAPRSNTIEPPIAPAKGYRLRSDGLSLLSPNRRPLPCEERRVSNDPNSYSQSGRRGAGGIPQPQHLDGLESVE